MNPLVEQQLKQIRALVAELGETVMRCQGDLDKQRAAYDELRKKYWGRSRQVAVISQHESDFETLTSENELLRNQHQELRERLERVLTNAKALAGRFNV